MQAATFPSVRGGGVGFSKFMFFLLLIVGALAIGYVALAKATYPPGTLQRPTDQALEKILRDLERAAGNHTDHYMTRCGIAIARLVGPDKVFTSPTSTAFGWYVEKSLRELGQIPECVDVSSQLAQEFGRPVDITEVMFFVIVDAKTGAGITAYPVPLVVMNAWLTQWGYTMQVWPVIRPVIPGVWPKFQ